MKASPILLSFNAGEFSPLVRGRIDLEKYRSGCEKLENFLPQITGPVRKRPGTRFVNEVKTSATKVRLIPFEFSNEQAYILEFGNNYVRFYANGGVVLDGGSPYEIVSPYGEDDLFQIQFAQSADVIYLAHRDYPPYKLGRIAPTNWTLEEIEFDWPPFNDLNTDATLTLTASGLSGTGITVTASSAVFTADDVGRGVKFEEIVESVAREWTPGLAVSAGGLIQWQGRLYQQVSGTTIPSSGGNPPVHTEGEASDGAVVWNYLHDGQGYGLITAYTSATVVTIDVVSRLPGTSMSPGTRRWALAAWSERTGYPHTVTFYEDRLWWAGNRARPQTLWASVSGDYENHKYGTNDDDALNYTINTQDQNTIQWILSSKVLSIGTSNGEFTLSATQISDPVTPTNVRITSQTTWGSADDVRPLRIGNSILFLQRAKRKLREYVYNFETDSYVAVNLTSLAEHIASAGIVDLTYQQEPSQIVWAALTDGGLIGMTYERAEEVVGWHRHSVSGIVESVATIPHWDGDQDVLWMVVRRTIDGNEVRYIEYMDKYLTGADAFFVDSGLTYDGAPTTTVSGLNHLEGEEVAVTIDGAIHPNVTVSSGAITLQYEASVINVGLPYTATVRTMPLEAGAADGVSQGKTMRVNNIVMRLLDVGPGLWYGPSESQMDEYHPRTTLDLMDSAVMNQTQDTDLLPWPGEYQTQPQITVQHRLPQSCTIVALMPQVTTYDR